MNFDPPRIIVTLVYEGETTVRIHCANREEELRVREWVSSDDDRWAIVAYIRALQLSQNAPRDDLSPDDLQNLETTTASTL